jgi:4-hydroxyphenylpyruvate dioxygenase
MRKAIATCSVSGLLTDKLDAVAAAGFDGVEIFDNDLISCPLSPREVAARCAELGLGVDLFQPVRDVQGVPPEAFDAVLHRVRRKLEVAAELGAGTVLACSNVAESSLADPDLTAEQLHRVGVLAAEHGVVVAFEALAWGRHVNRVQQAWEAVVAADHPSITLAVDTFHLLARGDGPEALVDVAGARIGFLQVADAPLLDMNVLEWSRHFRCFPGQGTLDVAGVVLAVLTAGYTGPLSLEVFSDLVREEPAAETARDAMRSLVYLEDEVAGRLADAGPAARGAVVAAVPPPAAAVSTAFLEVPGSAQVSALLAGLGFRPHGRHRTKPVTWWRNGAADVVVNDAGGTDTAVGLVAPPVAGVAARAEALLWPKVERTRGADEARLPGITSPSGLHVFVSAAAGEDDDWQHDFAGVDRSPGGGPLLGIDHVGVGVPPDRLDREVGFFRTLFGLAPGPVEEFMEPRGRLRSRALRPRRGDLRLVLNAVDAAPGVSPRRGVTQVAFGCADLLGVVCRLRADGVELLRVPDNYYVDLEARFGLPADRVQVLRRRGVLYDRVGEGELLHAYTPVLAPGFYVEVLERRGGYDGYGAANATVRLAVQREQAR